MALEIDLGPGLEQVIAMLTQVAWQFPQQAAAALRAEAEIEMTEAKKRTPVKTGALRSSGMVTGPMQEGDVSEVVLSFGGAASEYAIMVHENLEAFHRVGQAKFLESVILESAVYLPQRVAERIKLGAGAAFAPTRMQVTQTNAAVDAMNDALVGEG